MGEHAKEGVTAIVKYVAHWEKEVRTAGKSILVHCMRSQKSVLESIKCSSDFSDSTDKVFWGHSTTMWTKFYPILTIYRP